MPKAGEPLQDRRRPFLCNWKLLCDVSARFTRQSGENPYNHK